MKYEELKTNIIKDIEKKGYVNKSIDYQEFLDLYEPYRKISSEKDFAEIIGIKFENYRCIKTKSNRKAVVLRRSKVSKEREEDIKTELKNKGYTNIYITYEDFKEIFSNYENEMKESSFARILDISKHAFIYFKTRPEKKVKILTGIEIKEEKKKDKSTFEDIKSEIVEEIQYSKYYDEIITYEEFLSLYQPYKKDLSKNQFAEILGIKLKGNRRRYKINLKKKEINRVKYLISLESKAYTKDELESICEDNGITLKELLIDIYKPYYRKHGQKLIDKFLEKEEIFMGNCMVPMEFQEKYAEELLKTAENRSKRYATAFGEYNYYEDMASDALIYVLSNKGDIVLNAKNEVEALDKIKGYLSEKIRYNYLVKFSNSKNVIYDEILAYRDISKNPNDEMAKKLYGNQRER